MARQQRLPEIAHWGLWTVLFATDDAMRKRRAARRRSLYQNKGFMILCGFSLGVLEDGQIRVDKKKVVWLRG